MSAGIRIYRSLEDATGHFPPAALTIGNFDGVHAGHRDILRRVTAIARERGIKPSVLTFDPHPTRVVAPARAPKLMTTLDQRCRLMAAEGIQQVLILPFTVDVARLSPEQFIRRILVDILGACAVLVGENFRFGHKAAGNTELLHELGKRYGFVTQVVAAVNVRGRPVSSTAIRQLVEAGNMPLACRFLNRHFALEGRVVRGHGVGSRQTVPTLNLAPFSELVPGRGVYVTHTVDLEDGRQWPSVTNIGYRPTFGGDDQLSIETFLLDALQGSTPQLIRVEFLRRLRDEKKFESPEALKQQILRDVTRAQKYLRRVRKWTAMRNCYPALS